MEAVKNIVVNIKEQYTNISIRHKNQCPCHLQKLAALELVYHKPVPVSSDEGQHRERDGEVDIVSEKEIHLTYRDLFMKQYKPQQQKLGREVILVEGEAGMGKSVLCTLIVDDWASGRQFQEFSIVLLLPLYQRSIASVHYLFELISELYKFNEKTCCALANFLETGKSNILIIADGWDQLSESQKCNRSFLHELLFGNLFPNSSVTILITSRPTTSLSTLQSVDVNEDPLAVDRHITINGFSRMTIQSCVESEFSSKAGKIKCLTEQIENNPLVEKLCSTPLNLALICGWYQTCNEPLPYTMSELYSRLVWSPLRLSNSACVAVKGHHDLSEELQQSWWFLCEFAFANMKKVEATRYTSSKISHFGLLKCVSERQSEILFQFIHPTIQQYLAAQHLVQPRQALLTTKQLEQCAIMPHRNSMFWRFFLCAYAGNALSVIDVNIVSHAVHLLSKLRHSTNDLCHCSFEAKNEIVECEIIRALSTAIHNNSSGSVLMLQFGPPKDTHDCIAIIYTIESIKQQCFVEINLGNCNLTPEQAHKLGSILGNKSDYIQIKGLDLSHNGLLDSNIVDFFHKATAALLYIEKLVLSNCGIKVKGVNALKGALNKTLVQLDLSLNSLSMACLQVLQCHIETGILEKLEVLLLKGSLPGDNLCISFVVSFTEVLASKCPCLRHLDLSDNYLGEPGNPNLMKVISQLTCLRRNFYLRLKDEYMSDVDNNFASNIEDSIGKGGTIKHTIAHGIIVGPGRSGKDSLMKRLLGERLASKPCSTGVLERVVKVEVQKISTVAAAVSNLKWHRLEYDEEALELLMTTAKYISVSNIMPKPRHIKHIVQNHPLSMSDSSLSLSFISDQSPETGCVSEMSKSDNSGIINRKAESYSNQRDMNMNVAVYSSNVAPVDLFKKALRKRRMDGLREHLESSWSLYLTNTGGQTEFQELLPILVCGPTIFFIVFPLHFKLESPYDVQYVHQDGSIKSYKSSTTLIDEILQTLATISALDYTTTQCNPCKVPKVFFIGTHKDKLPEATVENKIEIIDKQLQMYIKDTVLYDESIIQFNDLKQQMIFTVNNLSTTDDDFQTIRSAVQKTIETKKHSEQFEVTCRSTWLIFSLILRAKHKSKDRFLTLEECFGIAKECGILDPEELTQALTFIHSHLGLVRYYNVEDLNKFVIIDPQVLFDKVTDLIVTVLSGDYSEVKERDEFQRGIVPVEVVERICNKCKSDIHHQPSFKWLTKLLNYLKIAALFADHGIIKYFFPLAICQAPECSPNQIHPSRSPLAPSLLIGFENGFCPRGIPGALIKCLMTDEMNSQTYKWEIQKSMIFRNQVSFKIDAYGSITLKSFPTHLEVYLNFEEDLNDSESRVTCKEAYTQIKEGMKAVTNQYIKCAYFFGFNCTLNHEYKVNPHPARVKWQKQNPSRSKLRCTLVKDLEGRNMPKGYDMWNIKGLKKVTTLNKEIDSDSGGVPKHLGEIADSIAEWEGKIAEELRLTEVDVVAIKHQWPSNHRMQKREALKLWKQKLGSDATYNKLIRIFERAGCKHYAENVKRIIHCQESYEEICDSDSDEDYFPSPQPQTYPNHEQPSTGDIPQSLISESYIVLDPAIHPGDNVHTHKVPGSYKIVPILSSTADDNGKLGDMMQQPEPEDSYEPGSSETESIPVQSFDYTLKMEPGKQIHEYQRELANPGINGENYIIVAPTGSGKTLVAALVISDHLEKNQHKDNKPKVMFIVNTKPLAEQQKKVLENFIPGAHVGCSIGDGGLAIFDLLPRHDIIVSTAGKFLDAIRGGKVTFDQISLIVIDECHHTKKSSPQANVMLRYLEFKVVNPSKVPQIMGLTASPGAGDNPHLDEKKTIDHLINLCALMDATSGIKMVEKHQQELDRNTNRPSFTLEVRQCRSEDEPFIQIIVQEMKKFEQIVQKFNCSFPKWSQEYETIVQQLKQQLEISLQPKYRDQISTLRLLRCCSLALNMYMDLTHNDAISVLEEYKGLPADNSQATLIEIELKKSLHRLLINLRQLHPIENPLLNAAKEKLTDVFSTNPNSKGIMFVRTKRHALSISKWIENLSELRQYIKPRVITGHTRETGSGMTQVQQEEVVLSFRESGCNLLIATSVAEEGLDFPACNLVIRFQHVSNEIANMQTQGRARAVESEGFTILASNSKKEFQELRNVELLRLVEECMLWFPRGQHLASEIEKHQKAILTLHRQKIAARRQISAQNSASNFQMMCKTCKVPACAGSDVYLIDGTFHHIVPDDSFKDKIITKPHRTPRQLTEQMAVTHKIHCTKCDSEWGIMATWPAKGKQFPVLKCKQFIFENNGQPRSIRKWSDAPFELSNLSVWFEHQIKSEDSDNEQQ